MAGLQIGQQVGGRMFDMMSQRIFGNDSTQSLIFLSRSTCSTKETIEFEGETYPLLKIEISNTSHPFYTGKSTLVDTAGRVDKFMSRYGDRKKK